MTPDDPRHGTYAGWQAHKGTGLACEPCKTAMRRYQKHMKYRLDRGQRVRIPIGNDAYARLTTWNMSQLARATGMKETSLWHIRAKGPDGVVLKRTRDRILNAVPAFTTIGAQRRLRALAAMGYSAATLSKELGISVDALRRLRRSSDRQFVRHEIGLRICAAYDRLQMTVPAETKATRRTVREARAAGWLPPLAYDDIDDPNDTGGAKLHYDDTIDPAVVDRFLAGDFKLKTSRAEKVEIMRRWIASGRSERSLCLQTGWKSSRYTTREDAA